MKNLAEAIIKVMAAVKGIEKSMTVGSGNFQYQGVSDYEVKKLYNRVMTENGLCILPIDTDAKTVIKTWTEETNYGPKQKQSVFTEVKTKYLLLHTSGESQVLSGYGQGVDSQDKGAGKATTYALKYALLYTFLTPTGKIDDSDNTHSEEIQVAERLPALKLSQFEATIKSKNTEHAKHFLSKTRMADPQRKELEALIK
jgi:hypothetical protein